MSLIDTAKIPFHESACQVFFEVFLKHFGACFRTPNFLRQNASAPRFQRVGVNT